MNDQCSVEGCTRDASFVNPRTQQVYCEQHIQDQLCLITNEVLTDENSQYRSDIVTFDGAEISGYIRTGLSDEHFCQACNRPAVPGIIVDGYCQKCRDELKTCTRCGAKFHGDGEHCEVCKEELKIKFAPKVVPRDFTSLETKSYNFDPGDWPKWGGANTRLFGMEIETTSIKTGGKAKVRKALGTFAMFESDGTIGFNGAEETRSSDEKFELITPPASKSVLKHFLRKLDKIKDDFTHTENSSCGLHIHVSRNAFKDDYHLAKFLVFFASHPVFVEKIGERKSNRYTRKERKESIVDKAKGSSSDKYDAVNLQHDESVEIRIFRSTMHEKEILKNIEFLESLILFTKTTEVEDINLTNYKRFLKSKSKYNNLKKFLNL